MVKSTDLLHAFRHPLVLISILVLLLNDHFFKAVMASQFTGKLSDLTGLFFFPFLLGTVLQSLAKIIWPMRRFHSRLALVVSFVLSAAVFTGIKIFPAANNFMEGLLSNLFQMPVYIALDPTDLAAFVVFIPAWMLWLRIEQGPQPAAPGKLAYAMLGLSALACVATSPCMPIHSIQRLVTINDTLYARMEPGNPNGFLSRDLGSTWEMVQPVPAEILSDMEGPAALPLTLCQPEDKQNCYRISGQPWVEGSQDGGVSWHIAWQIPPERERYINRANSSIIGGCGKTPNLIPLDMAFVTRSGSSTLVVAMGNEGVVVHPPSGGWQRTAVDSFMRPTRIAASNLDQAFNDIGMELILGLVGAGLIYLGLSVWAWAFAARHAGASAQRKPDWVFRPAWIILGWVLLVGVLPVLYRMIQSPLTNLINTVWLLTAITLPLCILIVSLVIWIRAGSLAAHPARYRLIGLAALVAGIVIDAAFMGCLLLWALGIIAMYESALLIAVIISISILVLVVIVMRRGLRLALSGFGPAGG